MSDLDREKLVDYVLGRMRPEDSDAFEQRARKEPDLARAILTLRGELANCSPLAKNNQFLQSVLNRKAAELTPEVGPAAPGEFISDSIEPPKSELVSPADSVDNFQSVAKRNKKRLRFIPKRVVVPRRDENAALIFKRAAVLTDEERRRKLAMPSRMTKAQLRSFFSASGVSYRLCDTTPNVEDCFSATTRIVSDPLIRAFAEFDATEENLASSPSCFESTAIRVRSTPVEYDVPAINLSPFMSDETRISSGIVDNLPNDVSVVSDVNDVLPERSFFWPESDVESEIFTRYTLNPLEYVDGRAAPVELAEAIEPNALTLLDVHEEPYVFGELETKTSEQELPVGEKTPSFETSGKDVVSARTALTREDVLAEISAVFGQSARIVPQASAAYYAVEHDAEDDEEIGPTLTAEDRRLAELLGHEPSAIERNEYYWEEEDASHGENANETKSPGLLTKAFLVATAPPVLVGRFVIGAFRLFVPEDFERKEAKSQTRRRIDRREPGKLTDVVVPMVAGVALAAGVVFPALKYVVTEIIITVTESKVRKLSGNVTISPKEAEFDVIPLISEQILFPRYEAVEFDGAATDASSMENDGLPVMTIEK